MTFIKTFNLGLLEVGIEHCCFHFVLKQTMLSSTGLSSLFGFKSSFLLSDTSGNIAGFGLCPPAPCWESTSRMNPSCTSQSMLSRRIPWEGLKARRMWEMKGDVGCVPRQRALRARPALRPYGERKMHCCLPSPRAPLPKAARKTKGQRGSVNYPRKHSGNAAFIRAKMNANTSSGCDFRVSTPSQQFAWLFFY